MIRVRKIAGFRGLAGGLAAAAIVWGIAGATAASGDERAFVRSGDSPELEWAPCPPFMPESCRLTVLHGNPAEPNADLLFKLAAGTTAPPHWHTSAERMVLLSGEIEATYDGQDPVVLRAGTYAYGPEKLRHHATCISDEDCLLFIALEAPVDAFPVE